MAYEWDKDREEYVELIKIANINELGIGGGGSGPITWANVLNKPSTFPPSAHNHDDRYTTKEEVQGTIDYVRQLMTQSQGLVAVHSEDRPDYLENKLDNVTISIEGSEVKVKSVDGLAIGTTQLNTWLSGTEANLQSQINDLNGLLATVTSGMRYLGKFETKLELNGVNNKDNGDLAVVIVDESRSNARTMYIYNESLGLWDFLGAFEFSDEFLALKDTPNSYVGQNGKVLKVDETNKKIVFSGIDYSEINNRPQSTITQIDNTVNNSHTHPNATQLAKVNESNGILTYNGVKYVRESDLEDYVRKSELVIPQKQFLYARRSGDQTLSTGSTCIFNANVDGSIPYNSSTGHFTLEAGKFYRVTVTASMNTEGYVILKLVSANNNEVPHNNQAIWTDVTRAWREASAGPLELVFSPSITGDFKIAATSVSGTSSLRSVHSALIVQEI